jgi:hypothetical protein
MEKEDFIIEKFYNVLDLAFVVSGTNYSVIKNMDNIVKRNELLYKLDKLKKEIILLESLIVENYC